MSTPSDRPTPDELRARVQAVVAGCIEAIERGEVDPAPRLCGGDDELLARVRKRLGQLATHGLIAAIDAAPTQIGPYRIVRELGSGGMGRVYLAEQEAPMRREVALKVVKAGLDTREVLARFQAERQTLARMSHPGIAQVFDAGVTAEGRPYFAMEHVPGETLTAYCDRRRLDAAARAQLVATICRAVQHAHDRGFIHRDLKPGNVLVIEHEGAPLPKVIDFGVAKAALGGQDDEARTDSLRTREGQVLGTPEYMSPEQMALDGGDVDTRTDVYALGVTLYELLSGALPFASQRLRRAGWREVEAIVRDETPPPPSKQAASAAAVIAEARATTPAALARELAGELDWIAGKALAKRRDERYPSPLALAEDLERWLRHEPVDAAPPGRGYRLRKFVRRHRIAVAAGAAVVLALAIGLGVSVLATARAEEARAREAAALGDMRVYFDLARDAVGNLVDVANEQLLDVPQAEPARRRMLGDALAFYEALRARQPDDLGLQRERLAAQQRIARLQRQLGQPADALATADACAEELRRVQASAADDPAVAALAIETATVRASALDALGRTGEARAALQAAVDGLDATPLTAIDGERARLLANLATHHQDDPATAIRLYEDALAALDRSGEHDDDAVRTRAAIANDLAVALTRVDRVDDADRLLTDAAARTRQLARGGAAAARESEARVTEGRAAVLRRLGRLDEAVVANTQAAALYEGLAREHPDVPAHQDSAAGCWHVVAQDELSRSRYDEALGASERAVAARRALSERFPSLHRLQMRAARSLLAKADVELRIWRHRRGSPDAAAQTLQAAVALADRLRAAQPDDVEVTMTYCAMHSAAGSFAAAQGDLAAAIDAHELARAAGEATLARHGGNAELRSQLATIENSLFQARYLAKEPTVALAAAERAMEHLEAGLRADARHIPLRELFAALAGRLAIARMSTGDLDGGLELLEATCKRTDRGDDAREQAALLLSQTAEDIAGHDRRDELLDAARRVLRERIAARGDTAAALARPMQLEGVSAPGSRLREFDLRVALGHLTEQSGDAGERAHALAAARALAESMPGLDVGRLRNLYVQLGEIALQAGDGEAAANAARTLIARAGEHGGANYVAAALMAGAAPLLAEAAAAALRTEAARCLQRAVTDGEVPAAAADQPRFHVLRGEPTYDGLLGR